MADTLMYILNDDAQNYPFCKFQLEVETLRFDTPQPMNKSPNGC